MNQKITLDLPEESFSALRLNPDDFAKELLHAAPVVVRRSEGVSGRVSEEPDSAHVLLRGPVSVRIL